ALLDAAGWERGPDGIREKDGEPLVIRAIFSAGLSDVVALATFLQADLREVGMGFEFAEVTDTADAAAQMEWDITIENRGSDGLGVPEEFLRQQLTPGGRTNYGGYDNPRITEITDQLFATV